MGEARVARRFQAPAKKQNQARAMFNGKLIYRRSAGKEVQSALRKFKSSAARPGLKWRNSTSQSLLFWWHEGWQRIVMTLLLYLVWAWAFSRRAAAAPPAVHGLGTDLSIVQHNDLYGASSPRGATAILLSSSKTQQAASAVCASLGEALWTPPSDRSKTDFLSYLGAQDAASDFDYFWVAGGSGSSCRAVSKRGFVETVNCHALLPALCTQSAPISSASTSDASPKWQTSVVSGGESFTGYRDKLSFRFLGIRYAAQPKRFTYSTVLKGSGNTSALAYGPQCLQSGCSGSACSEDCLFLNIWTSYLPNGQSDNLKPVMFWIHGGGFTSGTGSDPTFDGGNLAARGDVVLVTINYRLSTLGFLALDDGVTKGNYGIADQITALDWVRAHIKDFGGDPDQITIFGQSAGAASVRALLGSPKAIGKFQGAIPMSNLAGVNYAATYSDYYTIAEEVAVSGNPILQQTGCANVTDQLACLRAYDGLSLATINSQARYVVVDGTYITTDQLEVTGQGPTAHVPVMMGIMRDDGGPFSSYPTTTDVSQALSSNGLNASVITASGAFPEPNGANATLDVFNVTARVTTDAEFRCLDQASAFAAVKSHVFPELYFYEFNRSYQLSVWDPNPRTCDAPPTASRPLGDTTQEYFKCHSGELYYVFGTLLFNGLTPRDELDIPFSQYIVDSWTSFARSSDPNPSRNYLSSRGYTNTTTRVAAGGHWDPVDARQPTLRQLQWETKQIPFKESRQCDVLDFPLTYYLS